MNTTLVAIFETRQENKNTRIVPKHYSKKWMKNIQDALDKENKMKEFVPMITTAATGLLVGLGGAVVGSIAGHLVHKTIDQPTLVNSSISGGEMNKIAKTEHFQFNTYHHNYKNDFLKQVNHLNSSTLHKLEQQYPTNLMFNHTVPEQTSMLVGAAVGSVAGGISGCIGGYVAGNKITQQIVNHAKIKENTLDEFLHQDLVHKLSSVKVLECKPNMEEEDVVEFMLDKVQAKQLFGIDQPLSCHIRGQFDEEFQLNRKKSYDVMVISTSGQIIYNK